jgi:serine/threonine protein kinase
MYGSVEHENSIYLVLEQLN